MSELNRREVVGLAAGLAVGSWMAAGTPALGEAPAAPNAADPLLALAADSPQSFMLYSPETFKLQGDGASRDLFITSARDRDGKRTQVRVPSDCIRIFRADADVDEQTKQGGLHWRFHNQQGTVKLKEAGAIVMVLRDGHDTVRCYLMTPDERC